MKEKGEVSNVACLTFTRLLPGPIDKVWDHLTNTKLLPSWFGDDSYIEPRVGGRVQLMGGHIRGIVTQWRPPTKLIYTWNVFEPDDPLDSDSKYPESYPTFELQGLVDGVLLTFKHFPVTDRFVPQSAMGWHSMIDILDAVLRGREEPSRVDLTQKNAKIYGVDLDNIQV
jgi:uncharacterized protein YndB with AHSA1/START domain